MEELNRKMTADEIKAFEDELRKVEEKLEELGRHICSVPESVESWNAINRAYTGVSDAILCAYKMRDWGSV